MRFYNQVKIKGQECLEASITHNLTLWCLQKSVLGTMLSAIHWCLWFTFAVPGSRIACKLAAVEKGESWEKGKKNPLEILEFSVYFLIFLTLAQNQFNNTIFKMPFISRWSFCIYTLHKVHFILWAHSVDRTLETSTSETFYLFKSWVPSILVDMSSELDILWN